MNLNILLSRFDFTFFVLKHSSVRSRSTHLVSQEVYELLWLPSVVSRRVIFPSNEKYSALDTVNPFRDYALDFVTSAHDSWLCFGSIFQLEVAI